MKVTFISNSDSIGGAAVVTRRLMNALRREGVEVKMLVNSKLSTDPDIEFISNRSLRSFNFLAERVPIYLANGFSRADLFKVSTAAYGFDVSTNPHIADADVIVLSWVNQGTQSLKGIASLTRLGKPIVWIMHDMWCLTGICHHAGECERYEQECGCCPQLHSSRPGDLSHRTWQRKSMLYAKGAITFVAVSNWLAGKCRLSSLMQGQRVEVIHNAFPIQQFATRPHAEMLISQIDYSRDIILMGAARLDDPIKGIDYAIDALNIIFEEHPDVARRSLVVFFGNVRDRSAFDRLNFPSHHIGSISDPKVLSELYAASKVVLSTSLCETLPGTLIEGQAAGAMPVTFGEGGQSDIVEHLKTGYIARYKDSRDVADGILWALKSTHDRDALHRQVEERFSSSVIAQQYIKLFEELLAEKGKAE